MSLLREMTAFLEPKVMAKALTAENHKAWAVLDRMQCAVGNIMPMINKYFQAFRRACQFFSEATLPVFPHLSKFRNSNNIHKVLGD